MSELLTDAEIDRLLQFISQGPCWPRDAWAQFGETARARWRYWGFVDRDLQEFLDRWETQSLPHVVFLASLHGLAFAGCFDLDTLAKVSGRLSKPTLVEVFRVFRLLPSLDEHEQQAAAACLLPIIDASLGPAPFLPNESVLQAFLDACETHSFPHLVLAASILGIAGLRCLDRTAIQTLVPCTPKAGLEAIFRSHPLLLPLDPSVRNAAAILAATLGTASFRHVIDRHINCSGGADLVHFLRLDVDEEFLEILKRNETPHLKDLASRILTFERLIGAAARFIEELIRRVPLLTVSQSMITASPELRAHFEANMSRRVRAQFLDDLRFFHSRGMADSEIRGARWNLLSKIHELRPLGDIFDADPPYWSAYR